MERSSERAPERRSPSGARSGALLAGASLLAIALNYAFLLAAGRLLGREDYGALAALLGLLTVVLVPTSALQMAVSRDIARRLAGGEEDEASAFSRATIRISLIAGAPVVAVVLLLAAPLGDLLDIDPVLVLLAAAGLGTAFAFPAALGVLQGYQRFHALAAMQAVPFVFRLALLAVTAWLGLRLGGAVLATVLGLLLSSAVALVLIRTVVRRRASTGRPALRGFLRYLLPVAIGLVGITMLTNLDVLVVRARFPADDAGVYAAASAFARVAFFLPAAVLAVLFPRTAARQARGEPTEDILGRALLATGAFSALLALGYALVGEGLLATSFGSEFADGGPLLPEYALAIGLFSLANVLVGYHLSRGEHRYAWIVAAAVAVQLVVLAIVPDTLEGVIWTNLAVAAALLVAHELFVESSVPALRAGARQLLPAHVSAAFRRIAKEGAAVFVVYSALAVVITWPLAAHPRSTFIGDYRNDAAGTIAWLWRLGQEEGYHLFGTSQHWLTGAPLGWEQGNALNVQWLLPYYPAYLVSTVAGEVLAFNLVILSGLVFSAVSMYALARYLGCRPLVAGWAGLAFMFLPWLVWRVNAGHGALAHAEVLPLLLLALHAWNVRPNVQRAGLVGVAVAAAWLTYGYFGVMAVVGSVIFLAVVTLVRARAEGAGGAIRKASLPAGALLAATIAVGILTVPGRGEGGASIQRHVSALSVYGARPVEFVLPGEQHPILGPVVRPLQPSLHDSLPSETVLFLGWLTIGLAIFGFVAIARRRDGLPIAVVSSTAGLLGVVVAGLAFAAPSPISIGGFDFTWTPSWFVFQAINEFRVPSRFAALAGAALIPLAAVGLQRLYDRARLSTSDAPMGSRRAHLVAVGAICLTTFELLPSVGIPLRADELPPAQRAVERTPQGVLAEYPFGPAGTNWELEYVLWQRLHGRPLVTGARARSEADDVRLALVDPGAPGTAEALALLGVTAVVTRGDGLDYVQGIPDGAPVRLGNGYELVGDYPDAYRTWRVVARPAPALALLPVADFVPPNDPRRDGFVGRGFRDTQGHLEFRARRAGTVLVTFDVVAPGDVDRLRVAGRSGSESIRLDGRTSASIPIEIPRGRSRLTITIEQVDRERTSEVELSPPRASETAQEPRLRAELLSPDPGF